MQISIEELQRRLEHPDNFLRPSPVEDRSQETEQPDAGQVETDSVVDDVLRSESLAPEIPDDDSMSLVPVDGDAILDEILADEEIVPRKINYPPIHMNAEQQATVGTAAHVLGTPLAAEIFGVSKSHTHDLKHGRVGKDDALKKQIQQNLSHISGMAAQVAKMALKRIDGDKLDKIKAPTRLVKIAKDASTIVNNLAPKVAGGSAVAQVVIIAHEQRKLADLGSPIRIYDRPEE